MDQGGWRSHFSFNDCAVSAIKNGKCLVGASKKAIKCSGSRCNRSKNFLPSQDVFVGVFSATSRGYGFVSAAVAGEPDIFIPKDKICGALHSDTVEYVVKPRGKSVRTEGEITRVVSRGHLLMAGTFYIESSMRKKNSGYVTALDSKIPYAFPVTPAAIKKLGLVDGHRVMFEVSVGGRIRVKEIFGHKNDPGVDVLSLIRQYGVFDVFSEEALKEASDLPGSVTEADIACRSDFRDWLIITIDGSDTKDIDDAVSLRLLPNGHFELGVHISDVSHYVPRGSALDTDARVRGVSIYLADRVIPMLPHRLSNDLCSLTPNEDRLALSCIMEIDGQGNVLAHQIMPSVIHSQRRFTYDEVLQIIEKGKADKWSHCLTDMAGLADILKKKRIVRGALEFNFSETKITVDESGFPTAIEARKSNVATSLIEEFMIVCNETVAERCKDAPFVFRTHERPELDKMYKLSAYAQNLGCRLPISEKGVSSKTLQKLLFEVENTPLEFALSPVVLRSLKQAQYAMENKGHFGLASRYYCHFTSPIRRYPDLLVHRSLKSGLKKSQLSELCARCSDTERNAEALEREVLQLKKCQFMMGKTGQTFDGIVSGVVSWGVYVRLFNTVEGLVPMDLLIDDDEYVFVEKQVALFGVRKKKRIRLGDPFSVVLISVREDERKIIFGLGE